MREIMKTSLTINFTQFDSNLAKIGNLKDQNKILEFFKLVKQKIDDYNKDLQSPYFSDKFLLESIEQLETIIFYTKSELSDSNGLAICLRLSNHLTLYKEKNFSSTTLPEKIESSELEKKLVFLTNLSQSERGLLGLHNVEPISVVMPSESKEIKQTPTTSTNQEFNKITSESKEVKIIATHDTTIVPASTGTSVLVRNSR